MLNFLPNLPILLFHDIHNRHSAISFSPEVFQQGIAALYRRGYRTLGLREVIGLLQREEGFPERSLVITFDDGYHSVYEQAFPVLRQYAMTATVFLTVGKKRQVKPDDRLSSHEGRMMLSWREILEMRKAGFDFGAHSLTHPNLRRLTYKQAETEICDSQQIIEDALDLAVDSFAYPYGYYNSHICEIVQQYFSCACSATLGLVTKTSNRYLLERIEMYYFRTSRLFELLFNPRLPWYLLARSIPRQIKHTYWKFFK